MAVANATFSSPAPPPTTPVDGGVVLQSGYTFPSADQSFNLAWTTGLTNDPTGRFYFYYWDHMPTFGVTATDVEQKASPIQEAGNPLVPVAIYAGCTCTDDAGVVCADFSGGLMRDCRTSFAWDTHAVPSGTYWVIAVNLDPPFHTYQVAQAPVVIAHGAAPKPPAVLVVEPDGFGSWDAHYRLQWIAQGTAPFHFDLAYGDEAMPFTILPIGTDVPTLKNADGTFGYDWDISQLTSLDQYFVRVTVRDANGATTFTDSRFDVSVFHPGATGDDFSATPPDLSTPMPPQHGCSVELGPGAAATAIPLALIALTILLAARLSRRRA